MNYRASKAILRKLLALVIIVACIGGSFCNSFAASKKADFYDIKGHWAESAIEQLISKGIIEGSLVNGVREIKPDTNISRAEFVKILVGAFGLKAVTGNVKAFKDDKKGAWYMDALKIATSNSLIAGFGDGTFRPNDPIINDHVSIILVRLMNEQLKASGKTVDDSWYVINVLKNARSEFAKMPGSSFSPKKNATRAEVMTALYSFMKITKTSGSDTAVQNTGNTPAVIGYTGSGEGGTSLFTPTVTGSTGTGAAGSSTADQKPADAGVLGYNINASPGDRIAFQIYAYALKELGGFDVVLTYDPKMVIAIDVSNGSLKDGSYIENGGVDMSRAAEGSISVKTRDSSSITKDSGVLFSFLFRVLPDASGSATISMKSSGGGAPVLYTAGGGGISPLTCQDGKIIIK